MEYKTYKCDVCGNTDAVHLIFPRVDDRPGEIPGYLDLCTACLPERFTIAVGQLDMTFQRFLWKTMGHK